MRRFWSAWVISTSPIFLTSSWMPAHPGFDVRDIAAQGDHDHETAADDGGDLDQVADRDAVVDDYCAAPAYRLMIRATFSKPRLTK
jgi:hypothetical protein